MAPGRQGFHVKCMLLSGFQKLGKMDTVRNQQRYALAGTWWGWAYVLLGDLSYFCFTSKTTILLWAAGEADYWYGFSRFAYMEQSMAFP